MLGASDRFRGASAAVASELRDESRHGCRGSSTPRPWLRSVALPALLNSVTVCQRHRNSYPLGMQPLPAMMSQNAPRFQQVEVMSRQQLGLPP